MKKLVILLAVICSVTSCAKEEVYSCDPEADQWAKSNLKVLQTFDRSEWIDIADISKQRAAYIAFNPEQRAALWEGKFDELLKMDWLEKEHAHISILLNFITENPDIFKTEKQNQEINDKIEIYLYRWKEYAKEELGWDEQTIYAVLCTPEPLNQVKTIKKSHITTLKSGNEQPTGGSCDCNAVHSAGQIPCNYLLHKCYTGDCVFKSSGCGDLWQKSCDGKCIRR